MMGQYEVVSSRWCPMIRFRLLLRSGLAAGVAGCLAVGLATPALAKPATPVSYPAWASATRYAGLAFETCSAPPVASMQAWSASPYRAIGVYVGGVNRTCAQPELTPAWVTAVAGLGWRLLPIYKGLQAPCGGKPTDQKIIPADAAAEGTAAADDASASAQALGLIQGGAVYYNMEPYSATSTTCRAAVLTFLSAWTTRLHRLGYVSGVYANLSFGALDLASSYFSASYARPDALWIARWDGNPSLAGWPGIHDSKWAVHQRAKQYRGDVQETYGGVTMTIDDDSLDAPVGTTAYSYTVTSTGPLKARSGPGTSYPVVETYQPGATVAVACQAPGAAVASTKVWDKLADGAYVSDYYISTPSKTGYSAPITRCRYPYQVSPAITLSERSGPGRSYPATGELPSGALAWVVCQQTGSRVAGTRVWDKISYRHWVSDNYVATPSKTGFSKPAPRC